VSSPPLPSPARTLPLVELSAPQSLVDDQRSGLIKFPAPAASPRFRRTPRFSPPAAVPRHLRIGFILSRASPLLQSSPTRTRRTPCGAWQPPLGFRPPSRRQPAESTSAGIPSPLRSVPGVSHALDGLLLRRPCGFVSPRSHVRGLPYRGFPPAKPHHLVGGRCPHAVSPHPPAATCAVAPAGTARLQGLAPRRNPSRCERD